MRKARHTARATIATLLTLAASAAYGAGESGTESVSEMAISPTQLAMLFGGAIALGVVIWLVIKVINR